MSMIEKCDGLVSMGATRITLTPREMQDLLIEIATKHGAGEWTSTPEPVADSIRSEPGYCGTYRNVPLFEVRR